MKFLGIILTIICFLVMGYSIRDDGDEEKPPSSKMTCSQTRSIMIKKQIRDIVNCTKSMRFKNGKERMTKRMCIVKCAMKNGAMLNDDWKMPQEQFDKFIRTALPQSMQKRGAELFGICLQAYGKMFEPAEETCDSYYPFVLCFIKAMIQMCYVPMQTNSTTPGFFDDTGVLI